MPQLRFEDQHLTSFSGLIVFQKLFRELSLKARLQSCFAHCSSAPVYPSATLVLLLIVHMLLGYRHLRHLSYYRDDPLVLRLLGLSRLPHVATVSRQLSALEDTGVCGVEQLQQNMVLEQLASLALARVTLDFDGSVISTCRHAEGVAAGWNRKKRGQRSYYPLLCTVSQTAQVLAVKHRSGNVHDSRGAKAFMLSCIAKVRKTLPQAAIEVRMDSAFFSEETILALEDARVTYTISVPVDRYAAIKDQIEQRSRWRHLDYRRGYFERRWRMKSWSARGRRFLFVRQRCQRQHNAPLQLDLFLPCNYHYQYKIIVTNKATRPANLVAFHDGRGAQEGVFAELKSHAQFDYVPTNTWNGNKLYLLANVMAHNLARTLQMRQSPPARNTTAKRPPLWRFTRLDTLRKTLIQRAGRLIRPQGKLTLSMTNNAKVKSELLFYLKDRPAAA
ncbi:MAG: IS1380 family transposase [Acidiferrobacterales bacterium]